MRYTETSHKIENPADLIRVVSSCIVLSLFRMVNEYSKRVMFLGQEKLKIQLAIALGINGLLLVGEFISKFVIGDRVIVIMESHFIPLIISFVLIGLILLVVIKNPNLDIQVSAKPDFNEVEDSEDFEFEEFSAKPVENDVEIDPTTAFDDIISTEVKSDITTIEDEPIKSEPKVEHRASVRRVINDGEAYEGFANINSKVNFEDIERSLNRLDGILDTGDIGNISEALNDTKFTDEQILDSIASENVIDTDNVRETPQDIQRQIQKNVQENHYHMFDEDEDDLFREDDLFSDRFNGYIDN